MTPQDYLRLSTRGLVLGTAQFPHPDDCNKYVVLVETHIDFVVWRYVTDEDAVHHGIYRPKRIGPVDLARESLMNAWSDFQSVVQSLHGKPDEQPQDREAMLQDIESGEGDSA